MVEPFTRRVVLSGLAAAALYAAPVAAEAPAPAPLAPGFHRLGTAVLYVPTRLDASRPAPVLVLLHGLSQQPSDVMGAFKRSADRNGFVILAPKSDGITWDVPDEGPIGPDADAVAKPLVALNARLRIDPSRLALAGFSDGGTYALSYGLTHGDVFSHVMAYAAIRYHTRGAQGSPKFFFSHGTVDPGAVFTNAERMARDLEKDGYDVTFHEFKGGHWISDEGVKRGIAWFLK